MVGRLPDIGSVGGDRKARQQAEGESNDKQKELILRKKKIQYGDLFVWDKLTCK